jgi:hypothetical protein
VIKVVNKDLIIGRRSQGFVAGQPTNLGIAVENVTIRVDWHQDGNVHVYRLLAAVEFVALDNCNPRDHPLLEGMLAEWLGRQAPISARL